MRLAGEGERGAQLVALEHLPQQVHRPLHPSGVPGRGGVVVGRAALAAVEPAELLHEPLVELVVEVLGRRAQQRLLGGEVPEQRALGQAGPIADRGRGGALVALLDQTGGCGLEEGPAGGVTALLLGATDRGAEGGHAGQGRGPSTK